LVRDPDVLLLDEPLDSLDVENQYLVAELLAGLCDDGVTVLLVTHDLAPVAPHTTTVVYLVNGTALVGAPGDVLTSERLTELHGVAVEVLHTGDGRPVIVGQAVHHRHHHE
jgi:zinc/manganese transport system ATP-binding protein